VRSLAVGYFENCVGLPVCVIPSGAVFQAERGISRGSEETPRKIPRPASNNAGLRDDSAIIPESKVTHQQNLRRLEEEMCACYTEAMRLRKQPSTLAVLTLALASGIGFSLSLAQKSLAQRGLAQQDSSTNNSKPAAQAASSGAASADQAQALGCKLDPSAGTTALSDLPNYFAGEEDLRGGMTCTFHIDSKLPPFVFHFEGHPDNSLGNLEIRRGSDIIQTIDNTTDPSAIYPASAKKVLIAVDANFDGYKDLQLLSNCGATGNCSYDFYLYDPKAQQFVHNEFLSSMTTPEFDWEKKQVTSTSNSSANDWEKNTFQYKDGDYTLIHKEESIWDRDKDVVTLNTYDLRDGQLQLVSSTTNTE
jgi:hypothetical protein